LRFCCLRLATRQSYPVAVREIGDGRHPRRPVQFGLAAVHGPSFTLRLSPGSHLPARLRSILVGIAAATVVVAALAEPARAQAPAVSAVRVLAGGAQTIKGFGASGAWWPNDVQSFSQANQTRIAQLLFDPKAGLGLSIYRYNIGGGGVGVHAGARAPKSFLTAPGTYDWSADPGGIAFLAAAHRYGVSRLIGFANSAPPFFTSNGADCGGSLKSTSIAAYTAYLARVAGHLRSADGIQLSAVSPMNEPSSDFAACNQEGMRVPLTQRGGLVQSLARALGQTSPGTAVSADESNSSGSLLQGFGRWISSSVGSVAFHGYDYPSAATLRALAGAVRSRTGAPLEMSEVCCSTGAGYAQGYNPGMSGGLWLADTIWRDLSAGQASSFSWWTALSPELGCSPTGSATCPSAANTSGWNDGLLYYDPDFRSDGNQSIYFTRRYFVLANFSRYVRPGAVHYRVTNVPAGVHVIAFLRNTWRFVVINDGTTARAVHLQLLPAGGGHRYGAPSAYTTSATQDLTPAATAPTLDAGSRTLTAHVPARSVTTVIQPW
jgi:O-glycosyl hydrolase